MLCRSTSSLEYIRNGLVSWICRLEVSSWIDPTASEFEIPYVCKSISWSLEEFSLLLVVPICVDSLNIRCVYHQLNPLSLTIQMR